MIKERYHEFTNSQRSQIVWQILTRARYDNNAKEKVCFLAISVIDPFDNFQLNEDPKLS